MTYCRILPGYRMLTGIFQNQKRPFTALFKSPLFREFRVECSVVSASHVRVQYRDQTVVTSVNGGSGLWPYVSRHFPQNRRGVGNEFLLDTGQLAAPFLRYQLPSRKLGKLGNIELDLRGPQHRCLAIWSDAA